LEAGEGGAGGGRVAEVGEGVRDGAAVAAAEGLPEGFGGEFSDAVSLILGEDDIEEGLLAVGRGCGDGGAWDCNWESYRKWAAFLFVWTAAFSTLLCSRIG
jgi:hypothetical protein